MLLEGIGLYLIVLAVYLPWIVHAHRARRILEYPILSFAFLGMLFFNATGAIFVMFPGLFDREDYYSFDFVLMLLAQALLFYLVTGVYFLLAARNPRTRSVAFEPGTDHIFLYATLAAMVVILLLYMRDAGTPPMVEILKGHLDETTVVGYRMQATYDLAAYYLYNLGFTTFPLLLASQAFALSLALRIDRAWAYLIIAISIAFACLPGGKGSTLDVITALIVTYLLSCAGYTGRSARPIAWRRIAVFLLFAFLPVVAMYKVYYGSAASVGDIVSSILYRILGVYGETMAACVLYVQHNGFLGGATFPTIRGLLGHEQINLSQEMHFFLFRGLGGVTVPAPAEGYLNFGWPGFLAMTLGSFVVVALVQEAFRRIRLNLYFFSLLVLYTVFASKLAQVTIFATFISLTYSAAFLLLYLVRSLIAVVVNRPVHASYMLERR